MRLLITGSNGMLGTALCGVLSKKHKVMGMDVVRVIPRLRSGQEGHPSTSLPSASLGTGGTGEAGVKEFHEADITDPERVKDIFAETVPDVVVHTAAWTDVDGCEKDPEKAEAVNVGGTANIVNAAASAGVPIIFISTDYVFNGDQAEPYTENDMPDPLSVYGRTKYEAEEAVRSGLSDYLIVRTSWLYGKNGKNFVDTIILKAEQGGVLEVASDQTGSPTYAEDLADALVELIESGLSGIRGIVNISNEGKCSWFEFACEILKKQGIEIKVKAVSSEKIGRPAKRPSFSVLNNEKFAKITGHTMRSWKEALCEYLKERQEAK